MENFCFYHMNLPEDEKNPTCSAKLADGECFECPHTKEEAPEKCENYKITNQEG